MSDDKKPLPFPSALDKPISAPSVGGAIQTPSTQIQNVISQELAPMRGKKVSFSGLTKTDSDDGTPLETLEKSITNSIHAVKRGGTVQSLALDEDPHVFKSGYLWKKKSDRQIPNEVIKRIAISDSLVATILFIRGNHLAPFGNQLQDRFAMGFRIEPNRGETQDWTPKQKEELQEKIKRTERIIANCGYTEGVPQDEQMNLSAFLYQSVRNALLFGRFATEIRHVQDGGRDRFHSFRPVDVGTIYAAQPRDNQQFEAIRERALGLLEQIEGRELTPEPSKSRKYSWVQVINGRGDQAFTDDELYVHDMFPVTDIELMGYPLTPLDIAIAEVTTHINITTHNKLYFQNGRAARGMVVFQSDDVDQAVLDAVRQHFQATANSISNSFRVPIIGVGANDKVAWQPIEAQGNRDMEFQYLSDQNARSLFGAFQVSPEEVPGFQHLSRGSNSQTLSESNSEYKLLAARDVGIRPLLAHFQGFMNQRILPLIDAELAKICTLKFYGLDSDNEEKELTMLEKSMPQTGTYDEWLERVEKDPVGRELGGEFPLNPQYQAIINQNMYVWQIKKNFFGDQNAEKDPTLHYVRDPFWFQWVQLQTQMKQMEAQAQMMQQQQAQGGQAQSKGKDNQANPQDAQKRLDENRNDKPEDSAAGDADQIQQELSKAEAQMSPQARRILQQHRLTVKNAMKLWHKESKQALPAIVHATKKMSE